jgi:DNA-binding transcriptional LysR family regulator
MSDLSALHNMTLFVEVARTASFSRASRNLGVPGATLSRRIAAMERTFGVLLFNRTTRRVVLTEAGRRYFERCGHLVDEARQAQEALRETAAQPTGLVRLSMPVDLGVAVVGPLLTEFSRQFPGISFDHAGHPCRHRSVLCAGAVRLPGRAPRHVVLPECAPSRG